MQKNPRFAEFYGNMPIATVTPSEVKENTPILGPLTCAECNRPFFLMTMLPALDRCHNRRGSCPYEDCENPFTLRVDTEPEPPPKKTRKLPVVRRTT